MTAFPGELATACVPAFDATIDLGGCRVRIVSNVSDFPALRQFSRRARQTASTRAPDFELWCISLATAGLTHGDVLPYTDLTARARGFRAGYYVTDHFGPPVQLVTQGRSLYVFGEQLERIVWPYFVKFLLLRFALDRDLLYLKAGAFAIGSEATLVIGRGRAGKTVCLTQMCRAGARFVTNSHALLDGDRVCGVASSMRLRADPWIEALTAEADVQAALAEGEVVLDPADVFEFAEEPSLRVRNICFVEYAGPNVRIVEPLSREAAYLCAEQFALALNVYRLEEDLLDLLDGDHVAFAHAYGDMRAALGSVVAGARCVRVRADVLEPSVRDDLTALLASARDAPTVAER